MRKIFCMALLVVCGSIQLTNAAENQFADVHIHYNWDQAEIISADQILQILLRANTKFAVVSSTPSSLALELVKQNTGQVIALYSPYTHELGKRDWYTDKKLVSKVKTALESQAYRGIGEIHFMAGFPPRWQNENFKGLMQLARQFDVPVLIHVDSGDEQYFLKICQKYSEVRILFAHAGGNLQAKHIKNILRTCENVWVEFSARDPWRYSGLTDEKHVLLEGWKALIMQYPQRFMLGTDPVWRVTRTQSWDEPDNGWEFYEKLKAFHMQWIAQLPKKIQDNLRWQNAYRFFGLE